MATYRSYCLGVVVAVSVVVVVVVVVTAFVARLVLLPRRGDDTKHDSGHGVQHDGALVAGPQRRRKLEAVVLAHLRQHLHQVFVGARAARVGQLATVKGPWGGRLRQYQWRLVREGEGCGAGTGGYTYRKGIQEGARVVPFTWQRKMKRR